MAGSLNRVTLIGNLGADPEVRSTQSGDRIANLSVATSERWKDRNSGEQRERTEWHRVVIFGDGLAGVAEKYLRKGSKVYLEGQLETRKWQDQSGQDRYSTEVILRPFNGKLVMLDKAEGRQGSNEGYGGGRDVGSGGGYAAGHGGWGDLDDEVPFAPLRELP